MDKTTAQAYALGMINAKYESPECVAVFEQHPEVKEECLWGMRILLAAWFQGDQSKVNKILAEEEKL